MLEDDISHGAPQQTAGESVNDWQATIQQNYREFETQRLEFSMDMTMEDFLETPEESSILETGLQ